MKKIVSAADLGGAPIYKSDLRDVFNSEIWDAIQGLLSGYSSSTFGFIVSGCVFTNNAGNFDMTAGVVYLNGEFMRIPAATNQAFTKYIAAKTPTNDSRTFEDGTTHAVVQTKDAELVGSAPGSGQYITISSLTSADARRYVSPWIDITLINGWTISTDKPQYRIKAGIVYLRGKVVGTAASNALMCAAGSVPNSNYTIGLGAHRLNGSTLEVIDVAINTSGQLSSSDRANSTVLYLDGLSYATEPLV